MLVSDGGAVDEVEDRGGEKKKDKIGWDDEKY
jgi:hypothetical protein